MSPAVLSYLPEHAAFFRKIAGREDGEPPRRPLGHALKTVGGGLAGFGAGTLAGYGAGELAARLSGGRIPPSAVAIAAPTVGGAMGVFYNLYKQKELEELSRAFESYKNQSRLSRGPVQG
jgi:hypothetical protein